VISLLVFLSPVNQSLCSQDTGSYFCGMKGISFVVLAEKAGLLAFPVGHKGALQQR
jgi:hypothetical protein